MAYIELCLCADRRSSHRDFLELDGSFEENFKRLEEIEEMADAMSGIEPKNMKMEEDDPVINRWVNILLVK